MNRLLRVSSLGRLSRFRHMRSNSAKTLALANKYPAAVRGPMLEFRAQIEQLEADAAATPTEVSPPNWSEWEKKIRTPGVVDMFKQHWENLKPMEYDDSSVVEQEKAAQAALMDAVTKYRDSMAEERAALEKELEQYRADRKNLMTLTVQEIANRDPELKKRLQDELEEHKFF